MAMNSRDPYSIATEIALPPSQCSQPDSPEKYSSSSDGLAS